MLKVPRTHTYHRWIVSGYRGQTKGSRHIADFSTSTKKNLGRSIMGVPLYYGYQHASRTLPNGSVGAARRLQANCTSLPYKNIPKRRKLTVFAL